MLKDDIITDADVVGHAALAKSQRFQSSFVQVIDSAVSERISTMPTLMFWPVHPRHPPPSTRLCPTSANRPTKPRWTLVPRSSVFVLSVAMFRVEVSPAVQGHCRLGWRLFGMAASNAGSLTNDAPWRDVTVETNRWIRWMYPVARFT